MKNSLRCLFLLLLSGQIALGQANKTLNEKLQDWYFGTIVMKSGDVIECDFAYSPIVAEGLLQFNYEGINYTAGPSKVSSFNFYDETTENVRKFQSFPLYSELTQATVEVFFEILHESAYISLVGRKTTDLKPGHFNPSRMSTAKVMKGYERYMIDMGSNNLHEMTKKELLKITKDEKAEVKSYIKQEHLKLIRSDDFISVIDFYASLK